MSATDSPVLTQSLKKEIGAATSLLSKVADSSPFSDDILKNSKINTQGWDDGGKAHFLKTLLWTDSSVWPAPRMWCSKACCQCPSSKKHNYRRPRLNNLKSIIIDLYLNSSERYIKIKKSTGGGRGTEGRRVCVSPGLPNALSCCTPTSCGPLMCPLLAGLMKTAVNEAPVSEMKNLWNHQRALLSNCHPLQSHTHTHTQTLGETAAITMSFCFKLHLRPKLL